MMAVAPVTALTRLAQLPKPTNEMQPTMAATRIDTTGTLRRLVLASWDGISSSSPSAYDRRAVVPRYTMPVPAGEMMASISSNVPSQPAPTAKARVYQAPTLEPASGPSGWSQPPATLAGSTPTRKANCSAMYKVAPIAMAVMMAREMSLLGSRASPANWTACSNPCRANTTPAGSAASTPWIPCGMKPPPAVRWPGWNDREQTTMMASTGMAVFQITTMAFDSDMNLAPARFMQVNRIMAANATIWPSQFRFPASSSMLK